MSYSNGFISFLLAGFLSLSNCFLIAQSCEIQFPEDLEAKSKSRNPLSISQSSTARIDWLELDSATRLDEEFVNLSLGPNEFSETLQFSNFNLNIPEGSKVSGISIFVNGRSSENMPVESIVQLASPNPIGVNNVMSYYGDPWQQESGWWKYGAGFYNWGTNLTPQLLNSSEFGFLFQLKNNSTEELFVELDQVYIQVSYESVYSICLDHPCVIANIDEVANAQSYQWTLPDNFIDLTNDNSNIVVIAPQTLEAGFFELCVSTQSPGANQNCCAYFEMKDCSLGSIGNLVWNDLNNNGIQDATEPGLEGVKVSLFNEFGILTDIAHTSAAGFYQFTDLMSGEYYIQIELEENFRFAKSNEGNNDTKDSDITETFAFGASDYFYLAPGENRNDIDAGLMKLNDIKGVLWMDNNADGMRDLSEALFPGITVNLLDDQGNVILTDVTNELGEYAFELLINAPYSVMIEIPTDYLLSPQDQGNDDLDSDFDNQGMFQITFMNADFLVDGGLYRNASVGDFVWLDLDRDGNIDAEDMGLDEVKINLRDINGNVIDTQNTANGNYLFEELTPGEYVLEFGVLNDFVQTLSSTDHMELDFTGGIYSKMITLVSGEKISNFDFGFQFKPSTISGFAWLDDNGDGFFVNEELLGTFYVKLFDENDMLVASTTTDAQGKYEFRDLNPARYYLVFEKPNDLNFTILNGDSDVENDITVGATDYILLGPDQQITNVNAGYFQFATLGDYVWIDDNENGIQDPNEDGIENIEIKLIETSTNLIIFGNTDENGFYTFSDVSPGQYVIGVQDSPLYTNTIANAGNGTNDSRPTTTNTIYYFSEGFEITSGASRDDLDFGFQLRTGEISGFAWEDKNANGTEDSGDTGKSGVPVSLFELNGTLVTSTETNAQGAYLFPDVIPGEYYVAFDLGQSLSAPAGSDSFVTDANGPGTTDVIMITPNLIVDGINSGCYDLGSIGDYLWVDGNENGLQNGNENGVVAAELTLNSLSTGTQLVVSSDQNGFYQFTDLTPGMYLISIAKIDSLMPTIANAGNGTNDSRNLTDAGVFYATGSILIESGDNKDNYDFGFNLANGSIQGFAWLDYNADGIKNSNEPFEGSVEVSLVNNSGVVVQQTSTNASGTYVFNNVAIGNYFVSFAQEPNLQFSPDGMDSQVTNAMGVGTTNTITVNPNQNINGINAGYFGYSSVGDYVWLDENSNGRQNANENGIANIEVKLFDENGNLSDEMNTDQNGMYLFEDLLPGDYYVIFTPTSNLTSTVANNGNGDNDSDIIDAFGPGSTTVFSVGFLEDIRNIDGGFVDVSGAVSGTVFIDGDANGLNQAMDMGYPSVNVQLFDSNGQSIGTTMTDMMGDYSFAGILPGDYYVQFDLPNNFNLTDADEGNDDTIDSDVSLLNGNNVSEIFTLAAQASVGNIDMGIFEFVSIGDQVWIDENEDGIFNNMELGLEGMIVTLINQNGSAKNMVMTDADGKYLIDGIRPGTYQIRFDVVENYEFTTPNEGNDETIDSDAVNITSEFAYTDPFMLASGMMTLNVDAGVVFAASGMISGLVWEDNNVDGIQDAQEELVQGVLVELFNDQGTLLDTQMSAADGTYNFPIVPLGDVYIVFNNGASQIFTSADQGNDETVDSDVTETETMGSTDLITITPDAIFTDVNAGIYELAQVGDRVWEDLDMNGIQDVGEMGVNGVLVELIDPSGNITAATMTTTMNGMDGMYLFNDVVPGIYTLGFTLSGNLIFSDLGQGSDDTMDSDVLANGTGFSFTPPIILNSGESNLDIDAGVFEREEFNVSGFAFEDVNANGVKDLTDINTNGITVNLYDDSNTLIGTETTATDVNGIAGYYVFMDVPMGNYYVEFEFPNGAIVTLADQGTNDGLDSDLTNANGDATSDLFDPTMGAGTNLVCGGFYYLGSIGDYVWFDNNNDGLQDAIESGLNDIAVRLFDESGSMVDLTFTTNDAQNNPGSYIFTNVVPGMYYIRFVLPGGAVFTQANQGPDDTVDSDVTNANGPGTTALFRVNSNQNMIDEDAGIMVEPASVGNFAWVDFNGNGVQDMDEPGLNNVKVDLLLPNNTLVETTFTDSDGEYLFSDIAPGDYYLIFTPPNGYMVSDPDQGGDDTVDSDIMHIIAPNATNIFSLMSGENDQDMDAGFFLPSRIGDFVWDDLNSDGIQDANEPGIEGVTVDLRFGTFLVLETTSTDENGFFEFNGLKQGTYSLVYRDLPDGYFFSPMDQGSDDTVDSDPNPNSGETSLIVLAHGVDFMDLDAGIFNPDNQVQNGTDVSILMYPNPGSDFIGHYMESGIDNYLSWKLMNSVGTVVKEGVHGTIYAGGNRMVTDVRDLSPGLYYVRYDFEGFYKMKTLIIE